MLQTAADADAAVALEEDVVAGVAAAATCAAVAGLAEEAHQAEEAKAHWVDKGLSDRSYSWEARQAVVVDWIDCSSPEVLGHLYYMHLNWEEEGELTDRCCLEDHLKGVDVARPLKTMKKEAAAAHCRWDAEVPCKHPVASRAAEGHLSRSSPMEDTRCLEEGVGNPPDQGVFEVDNRTQSSREVLKEGILRVPFLDEMAVGCLRFPAAGAADNCYIPDHFPPEAAVAAGVLRERKTKKADTD